tara:strand:+ start:14661 stop:16475 length:1815 start_codon:yes stop_codon:yes gene_type:complete
MTTLITLNNTDKNTSSLRGGAKKKQVSKKRKTPNAQSILAKKELIQKSALAKQIIKKRIAEAKTEAEAFAACALRVNDILIQWHHVETGAKTFLTFNQWKERGFKVNKGEKSFKVWSSPIKGKREIEVTEVKTGEDKKLEENYELFAMCSLFHEGQVSPLDENSKEAIDESLMTQCIGEKVETILLSKNSGKFGQYLGFVGVAERIKCEGLTLDIYRNVEAENHYFYKVVNVITGQTHTVEDQHDLVIAVKEVSKNPIQYMALPVVKKEFSIPGGSSKKQNVEPNSKTEVNQALADKFNKLAEGLQSKIDNCFADRLTNTPRRLKQANQARNEGEKLDRTQKALLALSKLHAAGNVPNELKSIKSKSAIYDLLSGNKTLITNGWHSYHKDTGERSNSSPEAIAIWKLLEKKTEEQKKTEDLQTKVENLQFANISGYFPTHENVTSRMLELANISEENTIADTSAGSGHILEAVKKSFPNILADAYEINHELSEILEGKGFAVEHCDFLTVEPSAKYDRILINPPFEKLADIDHVIHSFKFLKPGGKLIAVMSPGPFFRMDKKSKSFRNWLGELDGYYEDLPENSFKQSGTNVSTKLIVINMIFP